MTPIWWSPVRSPFLAVLFLAKSEKSDIITTISSNINLPCCCHGGRSVNHNNHPSISSKSQNFCFYAWSSNCPWILKTFLRFAFWNYKLDWLKIWEENRIWLFRNETRWWVSQATQLWAINEIDPWQSLYRTPSEVLRQYILNAWRRKMYS